MAPSPCFTACACIAALSLHGCGESEPTPVPPAQEEIRVGTWNVLCSSCVWEPGWGSPVEIALCAGREDECTRVRHVRLWKKIDALGSSLDAILLQEADELFMSKLSDASPWTVASRHEECAVLLANGSKFTMTKNFTVSLPHMYSCGDSSPAVTLKGANNQQIALVAVHVSARLPKAYINDWYANATAAIEADANFGGSHSLLVGGDFNKNISEAVIPETWRNTKVKNWKGDLGHFTANTEHNDVGDFDGFLFKSVLDSNVLLGHEVHMEGFMPKHVLGYVQAGVNQSISQFKLSDDGKTLHYSATSEDPYELVPESNPSNQTLSDHFHVEARFDVTALPPVYMV